MGLPSDARDAAGKTPKTAAAMQDASPRARRTQRGSERGRVRQGERGETAATTRHGGAWRQMRADAGGPRVNAARSHSASTLLAAAAFNGKRGRHGVHQAHRGDGAERGES